jgi:L-cystine uptake protein TcyP (sodium:dicarboxylate symporter family)
MSRSSQPKRKKLNEEQQGGVLVIDDQELPDVVPELLPKASFSSLTSFSPSPIISNSKDSEDSKDSKDSKDRQ